MNKQTAHKVHVKRLMRMLSLLAVLLLICLSVSVRSNNIAVTNVSLTGQNTTDHSILVQFDISWDNSWRGSVTSVPCTNNWDAAWIFIKYRVSVANGGDGLWKHAWLHATGYNAPAGSVISMGLLDPKISFDPSVNPGLGAFLYRDAPGSGTFSNTGVQLRWNYGANSVPDGAVGDISDIRVLAIEMVAVPQGSFNLGSGGTESAAFYTYPTSTTVYPISSENEIQVGQTAGNLFYSPGTTTGDGIGPVPASFPKGYVAFYTMKYEILQQEYVEFLNTLTYTQQAARIYLVLPNMPPGTGALVSSNQYRNGIDIKVSGVDPTTPATFACNFNGNTTYSEPGDGQKIPCNNLGWRDQSAFLDWCGLRPISELEYEKACRGILTCVQNEFAWGTADIASKKIVLSNPGFNNESVNDSCYNQLYGNANYNITVPNSGTNRGPIRAGIFLDNPLNSGRITSGSTYYGIQEMTGNLHEPIVTIGYSQGRAFTGLHGNGLLTSTGFSDVNFWPSATDIYGMGFRGGGYNTSITLGHLRVSDRSLAASINGGSRALWNGGRGCRSVPPLTIDLNEPLPICAGDPLSFTATLTGTPPWNFTLTDGTNNFVQSNVTTTPYTFSIIPPPAVTTTYWISSVSDALGFDYTPQDTVTVIVNPKPIPSLTGPVTPCKNSSGNLYSTDSGMLGYTWVVTPGGSITAGGGPSDPTVTVTWLTQGSNSVSVNYSTPSGCTATVPTELPVSVVGPTLSGNTTPCKLSTHTYTTELGKSNYIWTFNGAVKTVGTGGTTQNFITLTWTATGNRWVKVQYTDGTCTSNTTLPVSVQNSQPTLTGPSASCVNSNETYITDAGMTPGSYVWTISSGGQIVSGGGSDDDTCTIKWLTSGANTVKVTYASPMGCTISPTTVNVSVWDLPVPNLTGNTGPFCSGDPSQVYTTDAGKKDYVWTVSPGNVIISGGGLNDNTIQIQWVASGPQWVAVNYTDKHGIYYLCTATNPTLLNVTVNQNPSPAVIYHN